MKSKIVATVLAFVLALSPIIACSTTWLSTFDQYLAVAGPALIQILDIISLIDGKPVNQALVTKIQGDQAALNAIAASVSSATSTSVTGACQQFNLAVSTFASDLNAVEQLAQINNPGTQNQVAAAVSIAQQTIAEVEAPISACATAPTEAAAKAVLIKAAVTAKTPSQFVKAFNAVVDSKHHIHLHSKFTRIVTFGLAQ